MADGLDLARLRALIGLITLPTSVYSGHFVRDGNDIFLLSGDPAMADRIAAVCSILNALPALLDAAEERDRLRDEHAMCQYASPHDPTGTRYGLLRQGYDKIRAQLDAVERLLSIENVEHYLGGLSFSAATLDYERTLVIGNIRGFAMHLREALTPKEEPHG